jgi:hypothetical protein
MTVFYPLGYPVQVEAGVPAVLEAARDSWSGWTRVFDKRPLDVRIDVADGVPGSVPKFRTRSTGFEFVSDADNRAEFSYLSQSGRLRVSRATLHRRSWFRYHFLEALTLTALDSVAFTPVHAACVARHGRGILLCGDSGSGKSSLAYACVRSGWAFVSDDAVHVVSGGGGQVIGNPHRIHMRQPAVAVFPELANNVYAEQPNGKSAIEVPMVGAASVMAAGCVFLSRGSGRTELVPFDPEEARRYFRKYLRWGNASCQEADFDAVLQGGCWKLEYDCVESGVSKLEALA